MNQKLARIHGHDILEVPEVPFLHVHWDTSETHKKILEWPPRLYRIVPVVFHINYPVIPVMFQSITSNNGSMNPGLPTVTLTWAGPHIESVEPRKTTGLPIKNKITMLGCG